ncbi:MAG: hypothetical protein V1725_01825 [archaeon]
MYYLLKDVTEQEYEQLKESALPILDAADEQFEDYDVQIKYNPARSMVSIVLQHNKKGPLYVLDRSSLLGFSDSSKRTIELLHSGLERRLLEMRLPNEHWI